MDLLWAVCALQGAQITYVHSMNVLDSLHECLVTVTPFCSTLLLLAAQTPPVHFFALLPYTVTASWIVHCVSHTSVTFLLVSLLRCLRGPCFLCFLLDAEELLGSIREQTREQAFHRI